MAGVYGDQLVFFPELLHKVAVFSMAAKVGAGYAPRKPYAEVRGYVARNVPSPQQVLNNLRTENQGARLFCKASIPRGDLEQGLYLEDDEELFQIIADDVFAREGGFAAYKLQLVAGNTDEQDAHEFVNLGQDEFQ